MRFLFGQRWSTMVRTRGSVLAQSDNDGARANWPVPPSPQSGRPADQRRHGRFAAVESPGRRPEREETALTGKLSFRDPPGSRRRPKTVTTRQLVAFEVQARAAEPEARHGDSS